ncbi:hypothetical protein ADUPG1_002601, partial [Aduncisulcus paluster]
MAKDARDRVSIALQLTSHVLNIHLEHVIFKYTSSLVGVIKDVLYTSTSPVRTIVMFIVSLLVAICLFSVLIISAKYVNSVQFAMLVALLGICFVSILVVYAPVTLDLKTLHQGMERA